MPFPWMAAAAGAQAIPGIASLFGKSKDNYHPEVWRNQAYKDYDKQIQAVSDAARKYGFHPLTLLGSGGFGGGPVGSVDPGPMTGDVIGDALAGIGQGYMQDADRWDAERQEDDAKFNRMLEQQRQIGLDEAAKKSQALDDEYKRELINEAQSRTRINNAKAVEIGGAAPVQALADPNKPAFRLFGSDYYLRPGSSDAQTVQNAGGEPWEWMSALDTLIYNIERAFPGLAKKPVPFRRQTGPRPGTRFNPGQ